MLLCLLLIIGNQSVAHDHCDLTELNHFHDFQGRNAYDQVIFYEWSHEHARYHVRSWMIVEDSSRLPKRNYANGIYQIRYTERESNLYRSVTSTHFRESWTQTDPERDNKRLLDERERVRLVQRFADMPKISPIAEEEQ